MIRTIRDFHAEFDGMYFQGTMGGGSAMWMAGELSRHLRISFDDALRAVEATIEFCPIPGHVDLWERVEEENLRFLKILRS